MTQSPEKSEELQESFNESALNDDKPVTVEEVLKSARANYGKFFEATRGHRTVEQHRKRLDKALRQF